MKQHPKRNYVLLKNGKETGHQYTGRYPRSAGLKAVCDGFTNFGLRERGTDRVHLFEGKVIRVPAPEKLPTWIKPDKSGKIKKATIKKVGTVRNVK